MRIRRVREKIAVAWAMLPLHLQMGHAWLMRFSLKVTRGARRKVFLAAVGAALVALLVIVRQPVAAALLAPLVLWYPLARLSAWVRRKLGVYAITRGSPSTDGLASARQTLLKMGLDVATADGLVSEARTREVRIARFDQENRVVSDVGPIPFFAGVQIAAEQFRKRNRHLLELVIVRDVVCVKKVYRDYLSFETELLALHAVTGLQGVPRIVAVRLRPWIVYQSFIIGKNLGSLMSSRGASDRVQEEVSQDYWGADRWNPATARARAVAITALSASVRPGIVGKIGELMERIHRNGVTITDVKYGNVLMVDDEPHFCDFDRATVYRRNTWSCVRSRANDREMFNYFFDGELMTERDLRASEAVLAQEKQDLFAGRIVYGHGYTSRGEASVELGSGQWRVLRPCLPDLVGKSILDLGGTNGLLPLEMLRAGARRVTAFEPDPRVARYGRLIQRWFAFVDNRRYADLQVLDGSMHEACERNWSGYDIATVLGSLSRSEPGVMAGVVRNLSRNIACLVVQAVRSEDPGAGSERTSPRFLEELLRANGYPEVTVVESVRADRPLVIGRRADS